MGNQKRELANEDKKKHKVIMLEVKSESTVSGGTEEIADRGNRDRDAAQDLQCAAREL